MNLSIYFPLKSIRFFRVCVSKMCIPIMKVCAELARKISIRFAIVWALNEES